LRVEFSEIWRIEHYKKSTYEESQRPLRPLHRVCVYLPGVRLAEARLRALDPPEATRHATRRAKMVMVPLDPSMRANSSAERYRKVEERIAVLVRFRSTFSPFVWHCRLKMTSGNQRRARNGLTSIRISRTAII
jgi:hypothetical protein